MQKFYLILGYIFTFGILYFVLHKKAKKYALNSNSEFILSNKIPFKIEKFVNVLGGIENIVNVTNTISTISITIKNRKNVQEFEIKQFKPKSYMWNANGIITIVFGDFSTILAKNINQMLNNN